MTRDEKTAKKMDRLTEAYIKENRHRIDALLRTAFLAGFSEGVDMTAKIYNNPPEKAS